MALTRNRLRAVSAATLLAAWAWAASPALAGECGCPGACDGEHEPACGCAPACEPECGCEECLEDCGCDECDGCGCDKCGGCEDEGCCCGFKFSGFIRQSYTWNPDNPQAFPFNGPVTFTDRANEYQFNQLYLIGERAFDEDVCGCQWGGRVDMLYGTDARFVLTNGLDDEIVSDADSRFMKLAIPQTYVQLGTNDLSVKLGHFYTIIGYEVVPAKDNFFVTQSYLMQYAEPFTHTGALASYKVNDSWTVHGGVTRGWDNFEDVNDDYDFLGGVSWSMDDNTSLAVAFTTGPQDAAGQNDRDMYSVVYVSKCGDCCDPEWTYIFQWDQGWEENTGFNGGDAQWYGFSNYLLYDICCDWQVGVRQTWFKDEDGTRVVGLGIPRGIPLNGVPAEWNSVSLGAIYTANEHVLFRTEGRWDWADPLVATPPAGIPGHGPFDDFLDRSQFVLASDLIIQW